MRISPNCNKLFETENDLWNHLRYRCGNPESEFRQITREGEIDRRTHHGFVLPPEDVHLVNNKMFPERAELTWNFLICNYKKDRRSWHQVFGHIRATHCHESRRPNERLGIPLHEQEEKDGNNKKSELTSIQFDVIIQRVREINQGDTTIWQCVTCNAIKTLPLNIMRRISKKHPINCF